MKILIRKYIVQDTLLDRKKKIKCEKKAEKKIISINMAPERNIQNFSLKSFHWQIYRKQFVIKKKRRNNIFILVQANYL